MVLQKQKDFRLALLREKDAVIATYRSSILVQSPADVESMYSSHADTHMSMGDTSTFVEKIVHWARHNKGCVVGAIVGPYGYGKTSTAIHLWKQCETHGIIAVPPFVWSDLPDVIDATAAWVDYRLSGIAPDSCERLRVIHSRYRQASIDALAAERGLEASKLEDLLRDGLLRLECKPRDVVQFLAEVAGLLAEVGLGGPIVFTDELQVTLSEYSTREHFMDDIFGLLNELQQRQGSYGLVVSMPTATEALIADVRSDIIHRMQAFNFYLRPETIYDRAFAEELWRKFAHLFGFTDIMSDILPPDTLKSVGQIAARHDLGAGPRTVIDAFRRAVFYYDESETFYTPLDLIDDYLSGDVAFDQSGKLAIAAKEALGAAAIAGDGDREAAVKLLAAYPEGCPEQVQHRQDLAEVIAELPAGFRREYLYEFAEGPSLRKLAPTEVKSEPVFIRLTKEFIGRYKEDDRHAVLALEGFKGLVMHGPVFPERRGTSLTGWRWDGDKLVGAFSEKYPDRHLYARAALAANELDTDRAIEELGLWFHLDCQAGAQDVGDVRHAGGVARTSMRLNATLRPTGPINVAYLNDLGIPSAKLTPLFMMALLQHLENNRTAVPNDEQARGMKTFCDQLLTTTIRLLFNDELREASDWRLTLVGHDMVKAVVNGMCEEAYPDYATFVTMRGWESNVTLYINALKNPRVNLAIAHGMQPLVSTKDEIVRLFGQTGSQPFLNLQRSIPLLLHVVDWSGRERGHVRLTLHPLEEIIRDALDASSRTILRQGVEVGVLSHEEISAIARRLGYLDVEVRHALLLLEARRFLTMDPKTDKFVRLIESPDERRASIREKLDAIRRMLKTLDEGVTDFNANKYSAQVAGFARRAEIGNDVEELTDLEREVGLFRKDLDGHIGRQSQAHRDAVLAVLAALERDRATYSMPMRPIGADDGSNSVSPSWQRYVNTLRGEADAVATTTAREAAGVRALGQSILDSVDSAETLAEGLVTLYRGRRSLKPKQEALSTRSKEAAKQIEHFHEWIDVPMLATRVEREVENCTRTYNVSEFNQHYVEIERQAASAIVQGSGLYLAATVRAKLEELERTVRDWIAGQRDGFIAAKRAREELLGRFSAHPVSLRANFDHYHPVQSREGLFTEVNEYLRTLVHSLGGALNRVHGDIAYLGLVLDKESVARLPHPSTAEAVIAQLLADLQGSGPSTIEMLEEWAARYEQARESIIAIQGTMAAFMERGAASSSEERVLALLDAGRTFDLGEIVRALAHTEDKDAVSLERVMDDIRGLFRKNRIIIKVERRP